MTSIRRMTLVLVPVALAACSRGQQEHAAPSDAEPAAAAVAPETMAPSIAGQWSVRRTPASSRPFNIDLRVDSVAGGAVHGRVVWYFVGDTGTDSESFRPFVGTLTDGALAIEVMNRGMGDVAIALQGTVQGDSVALAVFRLAGADLTGDWVAWSLVRSTR